ncbi:hypothetical protein [Rhodoferax ferrireducens]
MSARQAELDRLCLSPERNIQSLHGAEPGLIAPNGRVRAMVLELARPAD